MDKSQIDLLHMSVYLVGIVVLNALVSIGFASVVVIITYILLGVLFLARTLMYLYHELKSAGRL